MDTPRRDVAGHTLSNPCKKKGASFMVAAGLCVGLDGVGHVFPPCFIPPGAKINAARYQDMLRSYYDPWAKTFCGADAVRTTRALLWDMFAAIIKTHAKISGDQIKHMIRHFTRRLRFCLAAEGGYFAASLR